MLIGPAGTFAGIEAVIASAVTKHYGLERKNA
jgi:hypothetical protein